MVYAGWLNHHAQMEYKKGKEKVVRACLGCGMKISGNGNKLRCGPCAHDRSKALIRENYLANKARKES